MKLVLLGGLSGSGKSVALNMLEDLGYHTVDNLPLNLIQPVVDGTLGSGESRFSRLAIGLEPRSSAADFDRLAGEVRGWRASLHGCTVVYLLSDEATLIKRYAETRRRHPLAGGDNDLATAIRSERQILEPLAQLADVCIDTSATNVHELRELIRERVAVAAPHPLTLVVESFAYRAGLPQNADLVFDVRCLPNPYWEPGLRDMTGLDDAVADYLELHPVVGRMVAELEGFLDAWLPAYSASNRSYLTIAVGCTGGRHRSVYVTERLARRLARRPWRVIVKHGELRKKSREIPPGDREG